MCITAALYVNDTRWGEMRTGSSVTAAVHSGMAAAIPSSSVTAAIPSRGPDARELRLTELPRVAGTSSLAPPPRRLLLGLSKRRRSKRERLDAIFYQTGCLPCPSNAVIVFSFSSSICFSSCRRMRNGRHRRSYVLCSRKSPKLEDLVPVLVANHNESWIQSSRHSLEPECW